MLQDLSDYKQPLINVFKKWQKIFAYDWEFINKLCCAIYEEDKHSAIPEVLRLT